MLLEISTEMSVPDFMGYLEGKNRLMLHGQFSDMKFKYRNEDDRNSRIHMKNPGFAGL